MNETTRKIFDNFEVRKSKKQKRDFAAYIEEIANNNGYSFKTEKGLFGAKNLVVGDVEKADVIYTAHYDTCAVLPFPNFITPKNFLIYLLYQILIVVVAIGSYALLWFVLGVIFTLINEVAGYYILYYGALLFEPILILLLVLMIAGPANKCTANDNTSGVTTLVDIMCDLPEDKREIVAFVFFDLEEAGLFGSAGFASKHKKIMKNKLLINFDCVSDGDNMLFAVRKGAKAYMPKIEKAFESDGNFTVEVLSKGVFYPSDQSNFRCGVGVAALNKSKFFGILYMNKIHTKNDIIYQQKNIDFLKNGAIKLVDLI